MVGELRHHDIVGAEQPAVHVGKRRQVVGQIRVALGVGRVEHFEQVDDRLAHLVGGETLQVVEKGVFLVQQPRVFGVEQKDQAHDEHVEAALLVPIGVDVLVLLRQLRIQLAHQLAGLHRQLLLALDARVALVRKEGQQVQLRRQLVKRQRHIVFLACLLLVVNAELVEVAGDDPARANRERQVVGVPFRLLVGRFLARLLAALGCLVQADAAPLHLYQDSHVLVEHVDLATLHLALEFEEMRGVGQAQHAFEQLDPKRARMLFLHARHRLPALHEFLRRALLLNGGHMHSLSIESLGISDKGYSPRADCQCLGRYKMRPIVTRFPSSSITKNAAYEFAIGAQR